MPLAHFFHLSRREQNDHFMFGGFFVTSKITNNFVHYYVIIYQEPTLLFSVTLDDFIFQHTRNINIQNNKLLFSADATNFNGATLDVSLWKQSISTARLVNSCFWGRDSKKKCIPLFISSSTWPPSDSTFNIGYTAENTFITFFSKMCSAIL